MRPLLPDNLLSAYLLSLALVDVTHVVPMGIACASCKHCSTRTRLIICSLSTNRNELLVCDVVADLVGIFGDPLDGGLFARDYTVVALSQPILSWPLEPVGSQP